MPIKEYKCPYCESTMERIELQAQKFQHLYTVPPVCDCGAETIPIISAGHFILEGEGNYKNGFS
jgi:predicted nucleic acid-binding Zn ribbon protein